MSAVLADVEIEPKEFWLVSNSEPARRKILLTPEFEEEIYSSGRYEIVYGEIKERSMPSPVHGRIQLKIAAKLLSHVEENNLGAVYTETHFELAENLSRVPDIAFVSFERFPEEGEDKSSRWHIAPDLAVEVVSPTDDYEDVQEKITEYFTFGVRQVWIVSPESKTLTFYHSRKQATILGEEDELVNEDILPGFRLKMSEIFQTPRQNPASEKIAR
jgi:Uma2 family endonuclease